MSEPTPSAPPQELSCEKCRELLSDYVDRELTGDERSAVENHLKTCAKCGSESQRLIGLKNVVQHWGGVKGSGEFRQAVVQQMIRESQQMSAAPFVKEAGERASGRSEPIEEAELEPEVKTIPPVWILLVAVALAVVAYFIVIRLRGM
ncbi:MAG TPA: zf-HC2 domain-containing protein [Planctomycetota bacterium]|nr:zf-HC2 domain-containing protein [Planctomycetota bacterium]